MLCEDTPQSAEFRRVVVAFRAACEAHLGGDSVSASVSASAGSDANDGAEIDSSQNAAAALAAGGNDEGAPGVRGEDGPQAFYGAYFRDLDGNKLCAFRVGPA